MVKRAGLVTADQASPPFQNLPSHQGRRGQDIWGWGHMEAGVGQPRCPLPPASHTPDSEHTFPGGGAPGKAACCSSRSPTPDILGGYVKDLNTVIKSQPFQSWKRETESHRRAAVQDEGWLTSCPQSGRDAVPGQTLLTGWKPDPQPHPPYPLGGSKVLGAAEGTPQAVFGTGRVTETAPCPPSQQFGNSA